MIPWSERVNAISVNPDMATRDDVANLAADVSEKDEKIERLKNALREISYTCCDGQCGASEIIKAALAGKDGGE